MPRRVSRGDVQAFRDRLCAVAERRFAECGVDGVTLRQLAQELGCSPMTPYRYFRDKDEILAAVRTAALDRFAAALEAAARDPGGPQAAARAVGEAYLRFALEAPHAYRLIFDVSQPEIERFPELARASARSHRTMTAYLEPLVEAGILTGDAEHLGQIFWAATHGLVMLHLAGRLPAEADLRALHRDMMRVLARGARPAPPGSPAATRHTPETSSP